MTVLDLSEDLVQYPARQLTVMTTVVLLARLAR